MSEEVLITTVGTAPSSTYGIWATAFPNQRKTFIAQGREWVFYSTGSGTDMRGYFKSRLIDSEDWSAATQWETNIFAAWYFSVWIVGTTIHMAYENHGNYGGAIYYRSGALATNGTISWGTRRTAVAGVTNVWKSVPYVCVDSSGYPVIAYVQGYGTPGHTAKDDEVYVVIATATNGSTWGTPVLVGDHATEQIRSGVVLPLTSRCLLAFYTALTPGLCSRYWNGSSWGTEKNIAPNASPSPIVMGSKAMCLYQSGGRIKARVWSPDSWGSEADLISGSSCNLTKVDDSRALVAVFSGGAGEYGQLLGSPNAGEELGQDEHVVQWDMWTAGATGTIKSIRVKSTDEGRVRVAIYDHNDSLSAPDNRLNVSSIFQCSVGWNDVSIPDTAVTAGANYWLAAISDVDPPGGSNLRGTVLRGTTQRMAQRDVVGQNIDNYDFPAKANYLVLGNGRYQFLQGVTGVPDAAKISVIKYGGDWHDVTELALGDVNTLHSNVSSNYDAESGVLSLLWTAGASAPYNIRHLRWTFEIGFVIIDSMGFLWVEGSSLAYTDATEVKRLQEGSLTADTDGDPGYLWVEGNYSYYVDANNKVRRIQGTLTGLEGKAAGQLSINTKYPTKLCYIDSVGKERCFEGSISP